MKQVEDCAERLFALADKVRLQIVQLLRSGPLNVTMIAAGIGLPAGTMSHHLKILEGVGIIEGQRRGHQLVYRLHPNIFSGGDSLDLGWCKLQFPG